MLDILVVVLVVVFFLAEQVHLQHPVLIILIYLPKEMLYILVH